MLICHSLRCKQIDLSTTIIDFRTHHYRKYGPQRNALKYTSAFLQLILVTVNTYVTESLLLAVWKTWTVNVVCRDKRLNRLNRNKQNHKSRLLLRASLISKWSEVRISSFVMWHRHWCADTKPWSWPHNISHVENSSLWLGGHFLILWECPLAWSWSRKSSFVVVIPGSCW